MNILRACDEIRNHTFGSSKVAAILKECTYDAFGWKRCIELFGEPVLQRHSIVFSLVGLNFNQSELESLTSLSSIIGIAMIISKTNWTAFAFKLFLLSPDSFDAQWTTTGRAS